MNKKTITPSDSQELVTKFFLKIELNKIIEIINQQHISTGNQINEELDKINNKIYDLQRQLAVHNQKEYGNITKEEPPEFKLKTTEEITKIKTTIEGIVKTKEEKRWRIGIINPIMIALISSITSIIITLIQPPTKTTAPQAKKGEQRNENDNCFTKFVGGSFGLHCVESKR